MVDREMPAGHLQRVYVRIRKGGDVAQLVRASDRHADDVGSIPRCGEGFFFFPESTFSADFLTCVRTLPFAIARINVCAHVKDPVVHVRVR